MQVAFEGKIIHTQYCIESKRIDAYLTKYKVGTEIHEYDHEYRNSKHKRSRQLMMESYGTTVIRTNPDAAYFNINRLINQIYTTLLNQLKNKPKNQQKNYWLMVFQKGCYN